MSRPNLLLVLMALGLAYFTGCGDGARKVENYGDLVHRPEGVALTATNHKGGWGRTQCTLCHNLELNVHRSVDSPVNPELTLRDYKTKGGDVYCQTCHGSNGTE